MNGYQRIHAALKGEKADKVPITLHNFLMAAEEAGYTQGEYREDPEKIADSFIRAVEKYGYDGVLVEIDTVTLAGALGVPVDFPEKECARSHEVKLNSLENIRSLSKPDVLQYRYVNIWLEAARKLSDYFKKEISVRGNCDQAPFSLASMLRGPESWMMDLMDEENRGLVTELLDYCCEATCQFLSAMAETGADILSNGDSVAGPSMISPGMYEDFALAYEKKVAATVHALGLPYVLHICGNTDPILPLFPEIGTDAMELDYLTDIDSIYKTLEGKVTLFGTIDPSGVLTRGSTGEVRKAVNDLLDIYGESSRFVLNAGCAIPSTAPSANVAEMIKAAREYR